MVSVNPPYHGTGSPNGRAFSLHKKTDRKCDRLCAPQVGLEPTTTRLTAGCSAIELLRNMKMGSGSDLSSRAVSSQVLSALKSLTAVFGMGTGGTSSSLPPDLIIVAPSRGYVKKYFQFSDDLFTRGRQFQQRFSQRIHDAAELLWADALHQHQILRQTIHAKDRAILHNTV